MKIQRQPKPLKTQQASNGSSGITHPGFPFWIQILPTFHRFFEHRSQTSFFVFFPNTIPKCWTLAALPKPPGFQNGTLNRIFPQKGCINLPLVLPRSSLRTDLLSSRRPGRSRPPFCSFWMRFGSLRISVFMIFDDSRIAFWSEDCTSRPSLA